MSSSTSDIKRAKRESLLLREISKLFLAVSLDDPRLQKLSITRVHLSKDKGHCIISFYTADGQESFQELMPVLILYKPSLRKAIAQAIPARYTPDLVFEYDTQLDKQMHIERILDKLKTEGQP